MAFYKGAAKEGGRAMILIKKRQKEQEELEFRKKKIEQEMKLGSIDNKFAAHYDAIEQQLKSDTIGLVTLDEMKAKQQTVIQEHEQQMAKKESQKLKLQRQMEREQLQKKKKQKSVLSFDIDEDEDDEDGNECEDSDKEKEEEVVVKKRRFGKDPSVDTSFLPDRDREESDNNLRVKLQKEWAEKQEKMKSEKITITFSYWDGSGHRRQTQIKKGNSIQQFLQRCLDMLRKEFNELKTVTVDQLMYVKEDLIIPQHYTFYDFIVTKARGKSGPLFTFDAHEDIRIVNDAKVEKEESHAGKVCLRTWYERHKHIFPASRWEPYDPEKSWDEYTVSDKRAAKITVK